MSRLKCKYCGGIIKYNERKCPNCGANTSEVIDEYEEKLREKREEINAEKRERSVRYTKMTNRISIFMIIIFSIVFISISVLIITSLKNHRDTIEEINEINSTNLNEEIQSDKISVKIDEIKKYEMIADFPGYTDGVKKEGYQQMAFHLTIENLTDEEQRIYSINLLADGIQMEESEVKENHNFRHEKNGQTFENLNTRIVAGAKSEGWIGFYVKEGTKELKLKCENITVTIDNPFYTE